MTAQARQGVRVRPLPRLRGPTQQTCKMCGQPDKFDFYVPDDVWVAVAPEPHRGHVICLYCFDEEASAKGIPIAEALIDLCFTGEAVSMFLDIRSATDVVRERSA